MSGITGCLSFDLGVLSTVSLGGTTGLIDRKQIDTNTNSAATDATGMVIGAADLAKSVTITCSSNKMMLACIFQKDSAIPSAAVRIMRINGSNHDVRLNSGGMIQVGPNGASFVDVFRPIANREYCIVLYADCSANPHVVNCAAFDMTGKLIANVQATVALAAATQTGVIIGTGATNTGSILHYDDACWAEDLTLVPFQPFRVLALAPAAGGVNSFTLGDFKDAAAANIAVATDIYTMLDEFPPTVTDFAQQVVIRSTGYVAVKHGSIPAVGYDAPIFVQQFLAAHPVAGQAANTAALRLNDGGTVDTKAVVDVSNATDTLEYRRHGYQVRVNGGGAWTRASVNALESQFGFSTDATPPPAVDAIALEVVVPISKVAAYIPPVVI